MEQFFLRAVKAQLPVKANTELSHRPALVAESLSPSAFTMAFLNSTLDMNLCTQNKEEQLQHLNCYNNLQWWRPQRWQCVTTRTGGRERGRLKVLQKYRFGKHRMKNRRQILTCWPSLDHIYTAGPAARTVQCSKLKHINTNFDLKASFINLFFGSI